MPPTFGQGKKGKMRRLSGEKEQQYLRRQSEIIIMIIIIIYTYYVTVLTNILNNLYTLSQDISNNP